MMLLCCWDNLLQAGMNVLCLSSGWIICPAKMEMATFKATLGQPRSWHVGSQAPAQASLNFQGPDVKFFPRDGADL